MHRLTQLIFTTLLFMTSITFTTNKSFGGKPFKKNGPMTNQQIDEECKSLLTEMTNFKGSIDNEGDQEKFSRIESTVQNLVFFTQRQKGEINSLTVDHQGNSCCSKRCLNCLTCFFSTTNNLVQIFYYTATFVLIIYFVVFLSDNYHQIRNYFAPNSISSTIN